MSARSMEIVPVHPDRADLFERWHATYAASSRFGREDLASVWTVPELRVALGAPTRSMEQLGFAGLLDDEVVATAWVALHQLDNLERAECEVHVHPRHRRRGHGTAMLAFVESFVRARGRAVLGSQVDWPAGSGAEGGRAARPGSPGVAFAWARGFELVLDDVRRDLTLPVDPGLLDALAKEAAERHEGYELRSWLGRIPEDLVAGWAVLDASLETEAPTGALQIEQRAVDVLAVRQDEEVRERQGRVSAHTVALSPDGHVVAYTHLVLPAHEPGKAYQWGTLVARGHRGHRLGLAVKVANTRLVQEERPDVRRAITWNADDNAHMVAVNERLGFVVAERSGEFQKHLRA